MNVWIELDLHHEWHVLRFAHVVWIRWEGRLARWLSHDLANCVEDILHDIDFHAHRVAEEVLQLSDDLVDWHVWRRRILDNLVDLLEGVWLVVSNIVPILAECFEWHFHLLDEAVHIDWDPDLVVESVAHREDFEVDVQFRSVVKGLTHHSHYDRLGSGSVLTVAHR